MNGDADDDVELFQEAEGLEHRIAAGDSGAREELAQWILISPRHVEVFLAHSMASVELTDVDAKKGFDLKQMIAEILESK